MYIGFINIHPVTLPLGNELAHAIGNLYTHTTVVYLGLIKPELTTILEVIELL